MELTVNGMPSSIPSLSSYATPDGYRHVIVATSGGSLHEVFFSQPGIGVARLACFDAIRHVAGLFAFDDQYQIVIVATPDGNVHEIFFKPGDIHFTQPPLGQFNDITDIAAFYTGDDHMRIVIVATVDGNITEVFYRPDIGIHITQPPLAQFSNIVDISAFYTGDDHMRIVIVATVDGFITEVFYRPDIGVHVTQPPLAQFNNIIDIAAFYAGDDHMRIVIVATADGNITEVFYRPDIGVHVTQPPLAQFNNIVGITAFYTPDDSFRHVIVATADGAVTEIFYNSASGVHITQPPLARFPRRSPALVDISPDPATVDAPTSKGLVTTSTAGRAIGLAGGPQALYALVEKSGVWQSTNAAPWQQLPTSPGKAALQGPQIAINPLDAGHLLVGNIDGAWESTDGGATWSYLFDPHTVGCSSQQVLAVAFAPDGTLLLGTACGIASRSPGTSAFGFFAAPRGIRAFAISQTQVWARTDRQLLASSDNGHTWSNPIAAPASVGFDYLSTFSLAGFEQFAYMAYSTPNAIQPPPPGCCGADVKLLVYNAALGTWTEQNVEFGPPRMCGGQLVSHVCDGTGLGGRKFVKSFVRGDQNLPFSVGQRLQLFYGVGQAVYQADGLNPDGTVTSWSNPVNTVESGVPNPDIHADIWDFHIDTAPGGRTAWVACDGGVSRNQLAAPYQFPGGGWVLQVEGLHTHQIQSLTVLPTTPVGRSRLAYPTADNEAWCRDSTAIVLPAADWQAVDAGGDVNFSVGDAGLPRYALLARHRAAATLKHFGGPDIPVVLCNYKLQQLPSGQVITLATPGPDAPTTFQFIQAPKGLGAPTLNAVMMVDLPLTFWNGSANVPFNPLSPLGQSSNGRPVLIRTQDYAANPDINTSQGNGWAKEVDPLPDGTLGFYISGTPAAPVYYTFANAADGLTLSKRIGSTWGQVGPAGLLSSPAFGPAFVNPYDAGVLYILTPAGVQVSSDGGTTFAVDPKLTGLVAGAAGLPMSNLAHMAFNYDNPAEIVAVTVSGRLFFSPSPGVWIDLSNHLPTPRSPLKAVGIDCECIYVATDGRGLLAITDYKGS